MNRDLVKHLHFDERCKLTPQGKWYYIRGVVPMDELLLEDDAGNKKIISINTSVYYNPTEYNPLDAMPDESC